MLITVGTRKLDTARLRGIRVEAADVNLAVLSAFALLELCRQFTSTAKKCRRAKFNRAKKAVRGAVEQIRDQLGAEAKRRTRQEKSTAAAPLVLVFETVEAAGFLASFLGGLAEVYVAERANVAPQSEFERDVLDVKSVAFECAGFCRSIAAAICQHEVEV